MPQPIRYPHSIEFGIDHVLKRPELVKQIGVICSNWSIVEYNLVFSYAQLLESYQSRKCEDPSRVAYHKTDSVLYPVAFGIFEQIHSLNGRVALFDDLLKEVAKPEIYAEFASLRTEVTRTQDKRNDIAHGTWATCKCEKHQDALILYFVSTHRQILYKPRDFQEINRRIRNLWRSIAEYRKRTLENLVPRTGVPP